MKDNTKTTKNIPGFTDFAHQVYPALDMTPFHENYYRVLDAFAQGRIRKLMVTVPPQHGKSLGASTLLPAYLLGVDPDRKVTIASYSASLASRFNRRVQRLIASREYARIFPDARIKGSPATEKKRPEPKPAEESAAEKPIRKPRPKTTDAAVPVKKTATKKTAKKKPAEESVSESSYIRTAEQVEMVGRKGELLSVGREGALTGNQVDIFILDDLYKDAMEGNSPQVRENCWDWYTSVVKTRMHNDSSELIVFTRWHEEDLIGMIAGREKVIELTSWAQIDRLKPNQWLHLNFEALKESDPTEIDPRRPGEALWPERHSVELLRERRQLDRMRFNCMYQGHPSSREGLLYGDSFATYDQLPQDTVKKANYTDTADMGDDFLCSVCYEVDAAGVIYVTDVVYSQAPMEETERMVAGMIDRNHIRVVCVESNNGGRGFARAVARLTRLAHVEWFHQSAQKEARILSNSSTVTRFVRMPADWHERWPDFAAHITSYQRSFRANRWHDAPDVLTGIVEREVVGINPKKIKAVGFSPQKR